MKKAADMPQDGASFVSGPGLVTAVILLFSRAEVAAWPLEFNESIAEDNKHEMCASLFDYTT